MVVWLRLWRGWWWCGIAVVYLVNSFLNAVHLLPFTFSLVTSDIVHVLVLRGAVVLAVAPFAAPVALALKAFALAFALVALASLIALSGVKVRVIIALSLALEGVVECVKSLASEFTFPFSFVSSLAHVI